MADLCTTETSISREEESDIEVDIESVDEDRKQTVEESCGSVCFDGEDYMRHDDKSLKGTQGPALKGIASKTEELRTRDAAIRRIQWTSDEINLFEKGLHMFGKRWTKIAGLIESRTVLQVKAFARKFFQMQDKGHKTLDPICVSSPKNVRLVMDDSQDEIDVVGDDLTGSLNEGDCAQVVENPKQHKDHRPGQENQEQVKGSQFADESLGRISSQREQESSEIDDRVVLLDSAVGQTEISSGKRVKTSGDKELTSEFSFDNTKRTSVLATENLSSTQWSLEAFTQEFDSMVSKSDGHFTRQAILPATQYEQSSVRNDSLNPPLPETVTSKRSAKRSERTENKTLLLFPLTCKSGFAERDVNNESSIQGATATCVEDIPTVICLGHDRINDRSKFEIENDARESQNSPRFREDLTGDIGLVRGDLMADAETFSIDSNAWQISDTCQHDNHVVVTPRQYSVATTFCKRDGKVPTRFVEPTEATNDSQKMFGEKVTGKKAQENENICWRRPSREKTNTGTGIQENDNKVNAAIYSNGSTMPTRTVSDEKTQEASNPCVIFTSLSAPNDVNFSPSKSEEHQVSSDNSRVSELSGHCDRVKHSDGCTKVETLSNATLTNRIYDHVQSNKSFEVKKETYCSLATDGTEIDIRRKPGIEKWEPCSHTCLDTNNQLARVLKDDKTDRRLLRRSPRAKKRTRPSSDHLTKDWKRESRLEGFTVTHVSPGNHDSKGSKKKETSIFPLKAIDLDPFKLIPCFQFPSPASTPFSVEIALDVVIVMDFHARLTTSEVIGLVGGKYNYDAQLLKLCSIAPCPNIGSDIQCEMDPVAQAEGCRMLQEKGLDVVAWYHSHPTFVPTPSIRDLQTQVELQDWFSSDGMPFVGLIISPYIKDALQNGRWQSQINCITTTDQEDESSSFRLPFSLDFKVDSANHEAELSILREELCKCLAIVHGSHEFLHATKFENYQANHLFIESLKLWVTDHKQGPALVKMAQDLLLM